MRRPALWILLGTVLSVVAACTDGASPGADAAEVDFAGDAGMDHVADVDPNCHYDCPCAPMCADGVETLFACAPMPCSYSTDSWDCETSRTPCPFGCRDVYGFGQLLSYDLEPGTLCLPAAGHHAGDSCSQDGDCQPTWATIADVQVSTPYLACDTGAAACVEAAAPAPADWLQTACAGGETGSPYDVRWVSAASCEHGVCLVAKADGALRQGCSLPCTHDGQCPSGAVCAIDVMPLSGESRAAVCVPYAWLPSWD